MSVQQLLLEALQDLLDDDFVTFKWYLSQKLLDNCRPIARSHLEDTSRPRIVTQLLQSYGPDSAVSLSGVILQKMNKNVIAQELQQRYAAKNPSGAASATGPPPVGPGAPAGPVAPAGLGALVHSSTPASSISALDNSVVFAPMLSGGSIGTLNFTISK